MFVYYRYILTVECYNNISERKMRPNNKMFRVGLRIRQDVIIILFVNLRNYITLRKINV